MSAADNTTAVRAASVDLANAEARYHATLETPEASEVDRLDAADNLDRAQNLARELTSEPAEPEAEAEI